MTEYISVRGVLRISAGRANEIAEDVLQTLIKNERIDTGIKELMTRYDPESIMAGMRLVALLNLNSEVKNSRRETLTRLKNASMPNVEASLS